MEKAWTKVLREAGGKVHEQFLLRDTGLPQIGPRDGRQIDNVVTGLPFGRGTPAAVDATIISVLHADGAPWPSADSKAGACFQRARHLKISTYPELAHSDLIQLVTAATEVGGRICPEALDLLDSAAAFKARNEPKARGAPDGCAFWGWPYRTVSPPR